MGVTAPTGENRPDRDAVGRAVTVVANPAAGRGRAAGAREAAVARLRATGAPVRDLVGRDAAETGRLLRECVADGVDRLVVVGGDGTVHLAVQAVAGTATRLGVIPAGSGNDLARCLGLPTTDPVAAADRVLADRTRTIDLAVAGAHYFATVLAAGFDAVVNVRAERLRWPRGRARYTLATLTELPRFRPRHYLLDLDGSRRELEAMLVSVANTPSFGGGLRIAEGAALDDGLLDVVVIKPLTRTGLVRLYPRLYEGTHTGHPAYERLQVRTVAIASPGITAYADGERFGALPLAIECAPGSLRVLV